jgi:hypothetical protein
MKKSTIALIVILSIPVLTMTYLMLEGATFAVVHNGGSGGTEVSLLISSGDTFESTPDAPLAAAGYKFIWFQPKTTGALSLTCRKADGHWREYPLGRDTPDKFVVVGVVLDSCVRLVSRRGFSL